MWHRASHFALQVSPSPSVAREARDAQINLQEQAGEPKAAEKSKNSYCSSIPQSLFVYALHLWDAVSSESGGGGTKVSKAGVGHPFENVNILYLKIWGWGAA